MQLIHVAKFCDLQFSWVPVSRKRTKCLNQSFLVFHLSLKPPSRITRQPMSRGCHEDKHVVYSCRSRYLASLAQKSFTPLSNLFTMHLTTLTLFHYVSAIKPNCNDTKRSVNSRQQTDHQHTLSSMPYHSWWMCLMLPVHTHGWKSGLSDVPSALQTLQMSDNVPIRLEVMYRKWPQM